MGKRIKYYNECVWEYEYTGMTYYGVGKIFKAYFLGSFVGYRYRTRPTQLRIKRKLGGVEYKEVTLKKGWRYHEVFCRRLTLDQQLDLLIQYNKELKETI